MLMDEPFGAIDPINRERLQNEFLRLQAEIRKTIVFVTHDIDEAIKMGDRIAILQVGGKLAQYAPPAELLMEPAIAVRRGLRGRRPRAEGALAAARARRRPVARGAGAGRRAGRRRAAPDRGRRHRDPAAGRRRGPPARLAVRARADRRARARGAALGPEPIVELDDILRDALSDLLGHGALYGPVVDDDGQGRRRALDGAARRRHAAERTRDRAVRPAQIRDRAAGEPSCVERNGFCPDWIADNSTATRQPLIEHIELTLIAVAIGFVIAFALALVAHRRRWLIPPITQITGILYTLPSVAVFFLLLPLTGRGKLTALIALVSYTLLIIFRNVITGLDGVPAEARDAGRGMGLTQRQLLWKVELPLALPEIMAGLRIAVTTTVGLTALVFLAGAGGLGAAIFADIQFRSNVVVAGGLCVLLAVVLDLLVLAGPEGADAVDEGGGA